MDDGSTERLLVAELMKTKGTVEGNKFVVFVNSIKLPANKTDSH